MPNPFWNHTERRLRAFWRILLQGLLFVIVSQLVSLGVLLVAWGAGTASGQIPGGLAPQELPNHIISYVQGVPVWRVAAILGEIIGVVLALWLAGK